MEGFHLPTVYGDQKLFFPFDPTSEKALAEELQLQEALLSSLLLASSSDAPRSRTTGKNIACDASLSSSSSGTERSFCEICGDPVPRKALFRTGTCPHAFCRGCIGRHIAATLQENIAAVGCPVARCKAVLEPALCRGVVPEEVFRRWGDALCESLVLAAPAYNCPYEDCGAFMVDEGGEVAREWVCPSCRRPFPSPHGAQPRHARARRRAPRRAGLENSGAAPSDADEVAMKWLVRCDRHKIGRRRL